MLYDFTQEEVKKVGDIGGLIDTLSDKEIDQVAEFVHSLLDKRERKKKQSYVNMIMDFVIPLLKELAETTYSSLEIEQKGAAVYVLLKNTKGLDVSDTEQLRNLRIALSLADYVGIDKDGEWVQLNLVFWMGKK